jgi:hypothetical protein
LTRAERRPASIFWIVFFVAGALAWLPSLVLPLAAQARWGAPFQFAKPGTLDVLAPQVAISPSGAAAAAFGMADVDTPGTAQAYLTLRPAHGAPGNPLPVPGARQILALSYDGGSLELLTGSSPAGLVCCSSAQAVQVTAQGQIQRARTLVGGLAGAAEGRLLTLKDGQMLAAVATERGVWVVQSSRGNRFAGQRLLTGGGRMPESLAAAWLGGEGSIVAWTAATGTAGTAAPRSISYATGSRTSAPRKVRTAVTVPGGHRIDELGVSARGNGAGAAWIESWFDKHDGFHSQVRATDVAPHATVRTLSAANRFASGLSVAGDVAGDQALSWESCTAQEACTAQVVVRSAKGQFGPVRTLGADDPSQAPALAVGPKGQVLVGWVRGGRPVAATEAAPGRGFGATATLSSSTFALDITVGIGPNRQGLAAWTQGTLNPSVVGATDSGL